MAGHLTTEPCVPTDLTVNYNVSTAQVMWGAASGASSYSVHAVTDQGPTVTCNTINTNCFLNGLQCSHIYNVTVMAQNMACNDTVTSEPYCLNTGSSPKFKSVKYLMTLRYRSNHAHQPMFKPVWRVNNLLQQSPGSRATSLWVTSPTWTTRMDVKPPVLAQTQTPPCVVSGLKCGTVYNVWVMALGQQYNSSNSTVITLISVMLFSSAPCVPTEIDVDVNCNSDGDAVVSWNSTYGTANFSLTASVSGNLQTLCATQQNSCNVTGLTCGETYNLSLTASNTQCSLTVPMHTNLTTQPCQPVIVSVQAPCQSADVQISWQQASGVVNYLVTARGSLGYVEIYNITQTLLSAALPCGQDYNVTVQGQGSECNSIPSSPAFFNTTPCIPRNVTTYLQCELNMWAPSAGSPAMALKHTLLWQLGLITTPTLVSPTPPPAPGMTCTVENNPCVPQNLSPTVNCNTEVVSLSWDACNWTNSYTVSAAVGDAIIIAVVTTNDTTADFYNFTCGTNYSLIVTPLSQHCSGISSAPAFIQTCWIVSLPTSWYPGRPVTDQTTTQPPCRVTLAPQKPACSESNSCSIPSLPCGHNFSVSVTASNEQCNTTSRETTSLQSVPCVPTNVLVVVNCANNTAVVSWSASRGAVQYSVRALSNHGNDSCQTSDLSCSLDNLTCGTSYSVQVAAMDDNCSSIFSQAVTFNSASISNVTCGRTFSVQATSVIGSCSSQHSHTVSALSAPCQPQGISGRIDCVTNSAWISWNASAGADYYIVSAVGGDNLTASCTTSTNTTCEVEDLACGALYNFTVTAYNRQCASQPSAIIQLQTAPCSLASITAVPQCHNSSILVMWDLMDGGESNTVYRVTAEARDQTYLSCNSTGTSCYLYGAQCDFRYSIIVAASSDQCSSMRSPPVRISMEPCPPTNLVVNVSCEDNSALVSWSPSPVAETYQAVAMAADWTRPCKPVGLAVMYYCNNQSARLSWTSSDNTEDYYGCAQAANGDMLYCHSTDPTCTIQGLDCGTVYNFSVQASDGTCNSSFSDPVQSGAVTTQGRRRRDVGEQMPDSAGGLVAPMLEVTQGMGTMTLAEWSQVDAASHYSLIIKQQGSSSTPQELIVYGERMIFTDLSPNTIYCLTVSAMNLDTSGPESEPVCVQTGQ
ncbi:Fibronectin type III domain-containing protein 7 [Larimichthys crocea]|uniref:Uncharacterized protein n=1 Tax=Larimichthys crocea TaxID=215358 RepID=A0ACD3QSU0_LARCR|nr:Fibronectin type III domain-containing protein 7 [Larimichthys crocea]